MNPGKMFAIAIIGAMLAATTVFVKGSVIVIDKRSEISDVVLTNDQMEQSMFKLPGRTYITIPDLEGSIELRCSNGNRFRTEYVTRNMHTWYTVDDQQTCRSEGLEF